METANPLLIVEELLEKASPADTGAYALVVSCGIIDLVKHRDIPPNCIVLMHLPSDHINKGLSSAQWDRIEQRIQYSKKIGRLTPLVSQPPSKGLHNV